MEGKEPKRIITGSELLQVQIPLVGHIHLGYKRVKCPKCGEVRNLKEVQATGKCPSCKTSYEKKFNELRFFTQATNHFVVDAIQKEYGDAVIGKYGANPASINITFLTPNIGRILRAGYYVYNKRMTCVCKQILFPKADPNAPDTKAMRGIPIYEVIDKKFKTYYKSLDKKEADAYAADPKNKGKELSVLEVFKTWEEVDCNKGTCPYHLNGTCRFVATLDFSIAGCGEQFGVWRVATTSLTSFRNIYAALLPLVNIYAMNRGFHLVAPPVKLILEPGQKLVEGKFKKTLYFLKINYDLPVLLKARSQFLLEQGRTGITFDTDVVVDTPPEKDAPVDIVSEHAEEAEVIQETITSAAEDTTAGAAGGEEPGTHQPSQPGDGATKASQKPADILKELAPFFKMLKDGKPIITNTDVAVIYKKLGVKAETKPSAVAPEKLPALLVEVKALVEKKKTATAEPAGGKKSGPGVKKTEDPF